MSDGVDPTAALLLAMCDRLTREKQEVARLRLVVEQVAKLLLEGLE
jgi:hypothetical protein